ncbi:hypothetical protein DLJ53_17850 [Acuticoccus sediminis]|uniref:Uncharacterized protein n=2 Tax=Acuticoccus sediminis TaxID=2184697 RepID=A0A8B2NS00_9HYPH|nr:hypothetical protein DLJ53_17850 [Acuticoccus sediminis]
MLSKPALADRAIMSFNVDRAKLFDIESASEEVRRLLPSFAAAVEAERAKLEQIEPIIESGGLLRFLPAKALSRSLLCLVAESDYFGTIRFTEKSIKPIIFHRPFLVVGSAGTLAEIQDMGFITFAELINEAYDNEPQPDRRLMMVMKELHNILEWTSAPKGRRYFLDAVRPRLVANQLHFQNSIKRTMLERLRGDLRSVISATAHNGA